jgi:hypothetical protein
MWDLRCGVADLGGIEHREEYFEFVLRTPTLRAGSQFRIANCEWRM